MSEIFREAPKEAPAEVKSESTEENVTKGENYATVNETEVSKEFKENLEAWEFEGKKKYVNEYFDTHNIYNDFSSKMQISAIDKFVRGELEEKKQAKTIANYKKILQDIESEIGSDRLELFERFKKLNGYIKAIRRLRDVKKKLGTYTANE